MLRPSLIVVLSLGLLGCQRQHAEPRVLEGSGTLNESRSPEAIQDNGLFDLVGKSMSIRDLEAVFLPRPIADAQPQFSSAPILIKGWASDDLAVCAGGPRSLYADEAGETWLQVAEGFTGRVSWYGPVHLDELRALTAALPDRD